MDDGYAARVGRMVDVADLIDANMVASILGLSRGNAVTVYQSRYPDMPRPVYAPGDRRTRLWLRSEIEAWANTRRDAQQQRKRGESQ